MAAVTAFAARKPAPTAAASFGIRWAIGHGAVIIIAGLALTTLGLAIPEAATNWLDRLVGVALIGLGGWTAWHATQLHAHVHSHDGLPHLHLHSHALSSNHEHSHAPTLMGALHGLAGAAPAIALLQVTRFDTVVQGMAYLLSYAIGTALGMAAYALLAGYIMGRTAIRSERWARRIGQGAGVLTILIGFFWLAR